MGGRSETITCVSQRKCVVIGFVKASTETRTSINKTNITGACVCVCGSANDGGKEGSQTVSKGGDPFVVEMLLVSSSFVVAFCSVACWFGRERRRRFVVVIRTDSWTLVGRLVSVGVRVCLCRVYS